MYELFKFDPFKAPDPLSHKVKMVAEKRSAETTSKPAQKFSRSVLRPEPATNSPLLAVQLSQESQTSLVARFMSLHPIAKDAFEERAAILEYEGGFHRREAEAEAMRMTLALFTAER